jgi:hypothetical protein
MRRIGVLMNLAAGDPEGEARIAAFLQALQQLGWSDGRKAPTDAIAAWDALFSARSCCQSITPRGETCVDPT